MSAQLGMQHLFYTINIATLATWASLAGFGTLGVLVPESRSKPIVSKALETKWVKEDFTLGEDGDATASEEAASEFTAQNPVAALPSPPELPALVEQELLPEIPDFPAQEPEQPAKIKPTTRPSIQPKRSVQPSATATARPGTRITGDSGVKAAQTKGSGSGTGMSDSARIAAGRMPKPPYPVESRRKNQTGTVTIVFTVDETGRVVSASVQSSSGWPNLDNAATRTILQKWKFPPGAKMTKIKTVVFRLN